MPFPSIPITCPIDEQHLVSWWAERPNDARNLAARIYRRAEKQERHSSKYGWSAKHINEVDELRLFASLLGMIADGRLRLET